MNVAPDSKPESSAPPSARGNAIHKEKKDELILAPPFASAVLGATRGEEKMDKRSKKASNLLHLDPAVADDLNNVEESLLTRKHSDVLNDSWQLAPGIDDNLEDATPLKRAEARNTRRFRKSSSLKNRAADDTNILKVYGSDEPEASGAAAMRQHGRKDESDDDDDEGFISGDNTIAGAIHIGNGPMSENQRLEEELEEGGGGLEAPIQAKLVEEETIAEAEVVVEKNTQRMKTIVVVGIIAIIAAILLGTLLGKQSEKLAETPSSAPTQTSLEFLRAILYPVSGELLFNVSSHQYKALEWLAYNDTAQIFRNESIVERDIIERYVIVDLYFATDGHHAGLDHSLHFLSNTSVCHWNQGGEFDDAELRGVYCDSFGSEVAVSALRIDGVQNPISGSIPSELGHLQFLTLLSFHDTSLIDGTIPSSLGNMDSLKRFELVYTAISGTIPTELGSASHLTSLEMIGNDMLTGTIPEAVTHLEALEALTLRANSLTGPIPEFRPRTPLKEVWLSDNYLTSTIPSSIYFLESLTDLSLNYNFLTGTISEEIASLTKLKYLWLYNNDMSGPLPDYFPSPLVSIDIDINAFEGTLPTAIGELIALETLSVSENLLSGPIPTEIGRLINLEYIILSSNRITGSVPEELAELRYLYKFFIDYNHLTGTIPEAFSHSGEGYKIVFLQGNNITGDLDPAFCNPTAPVFYSVAADCGGENPDVTCSCCVECLDEATGLLALNAISECEIWNRDFVFSNACDWSCSPCAESGTSFFVPDIPVLASSTCATPNSTCNLDTTVCFRTTELFEVYPGNYLENDNSSEGQWTLEYTKGRNGVITIYNYWYNETILAVNGRECSNAVFDFACPDGSEAPKFDCTNVLVEGGFFNGCEFWNYEGGDLEMFAIMISKAYEGCEDLPDFEHLGNWCGTYNFDGDQGCQKGHLNYTLYMA